MSNQTPTVLHTVLNGGAYVSVRLGPYFIDLEAMPTAGCARIVTWRLPSDDQEGAVGVLIECVLKQAQRYKGIVRIAAPTIDLAFIKALHKAGFKGDVVHHRGRIVELTRRFV